MMARHPPLVSARVLPQCSRDLVVRDVVGAIGVEAAEDFSEGFGRGLDLKLHHGILELGP